MQISRIEGLIKSRLQIYRPYYTTEQVRTIENTKPQNRKEKHISIPKLCLFAQRTLQHIPSKLNIVHTNTQKIKREKKLWQRRKRRLLKYRRLR